MTESDHSDGDRPTVGGDDRPPASLDEPVADRVTLARRLRAVERALAGTDGVEFETGVAERDIGAMEDRIASIEEHLDALHRAVAEVGECLVARDRARRIDDGTESVRRAVDALSDAGVGVHATDGGTTDRLALTDGNGDTDPSETGSEIDRQGSLEGESPAEWLDRVAAGGVAPPRLE